MPTGKCSGSPGFCLVHAVRPRRAIRRRTVRPMHDRRAVFGWCNQHHPANCSTTSRFVDCRQRGWNDRFNDKPYICCCASVSWSPLEKGRCVGLGCWRQRCCRTNIRRPDSAPWRSRPVRTAAETSRADVRDGPVRVGPLLAKWPVCPACEDSFRCCVFGPVLRACDSVVMDADIFAKRSDVNVSCCTI